MVIIFHQRNGVKYLPRWFWHDRSEMIKSSVANIIIFLKLQLLTLAMIRLSSNKLPAWYLQKKSDTCNLTKVHILASYLLFLIAKQATIYGVTVKIQISWHIECWIISNKIIPLIFTLINNQLLRGPYEP